MRRAYAYGAAKCSIVWQNALTSKERVTVNLDTVEYRELQGLAKEHNVSMAWLGRKAIVLLLEQSKQRELPFPLAPARGRIRR